jgi:hypothetical protein
MNESEKQFFFTRVALSTCGRAKNQIPISNYQRASSKLYKLIFAIVATIWLLSREFMLLAQFALPPLPPINISSTTTNWDSTLKHGACVAFNGTQYLVVWRDERQPASGDVFGARVTTSGVVLDPNGISISSIPNNQNDPAPRVAACGDTFLVVWNYQSPSSSKGSSVYGCRVGADGRVMDTSGILIASGSSAYANVAANESKWLVDWRSTLLDSAGDIFGAFVSTNGEVASPGSFGICTAASSQSVSSIASDGTNFFVAWHDYRNGATRNWDIYGTLVSSSGTIVSPGGMLIAGAKNEQWFPNVACNGSEYLVTWEDGRNEVTFLTNSDIYGAWIDLSGALLNPNPIPICTAPGNQLDPAAAFDGTNGFVVWWDSRNGTNNANIYTNNYDIYGVSIIAGGQVASASGWPINCDPSNQDHPHIAFGKDHQFLVVHSANNITNSTYKIMGNFIYSQEPDLRITSSQFGNGQGTLGWNSVPSFTYQILSASQLTGPWNPVLSNVVATSTLSSVTFAASGAAQQFFWLSRVK